MIATVTFNPSLDYVVAVDDFHAGTLNRTTEEHIFPGGKGINVSIMLNVLGVQETTAYGFIAGSTGAILVNLLKEKKIKTDFIELEKGFTRINVKLRSVAETEINGRGPYIGTENLHVLHEKLDLLNSDDILVLSGSIPPYLPQTVYMDIMDRLQNKNMKIIVDATRDLFVKVLPYHPFLVKPNGEELGEIFHVQIASISDAIIYGKKLQNAGAANVLVSLGGKGAVLIDAEGEIYRAAAPKGKVLNSVGAGDSMIAGFIAGYLKKGSYQEALRLGICAGSATAFSEDLADTETVGALYVSVKNPEKV